MGINVKHLLDRPCSVCEFHKENGGCCKWACVFEQEPTTKNKLGVDCISRKQVLHWLENATDDNIENALNNNLDFIPSVTPQEPILDKIRAEIKHHSEHFINDDGDDCLAVYEDDVFEIIDKYKAESEVEDGNDD